tara:strand:+ start:460 stop:1296 length:837 start_codon:yes stop_codon:yes gene_type:complete
MKKRTRLFALCTLASVSLGSTLVAKADGDLASAAQNPIASMISLPIDTSFDFGAANGSAIVANVQPVIPTSFNEDWNLVSRFILPIAWVEGAVGGVAGLPAEANTVDPNRSASGLGDLNYTGFFSPAVAGDIIWGVGPSLMLPTATDDLLGSEKWSAGPSVVILTQPAPWSLGLIYRHLWSFEGAADRASVNQSMIQYFINYNLDDGWYLMTDPVIFANWGVSSSDRWTVPFGGGVGRIFKIGEQPVNARLRSYYNVVRPTGSPEWSINASIAFLFPK